MAQPGRGKIEDRLAVRERPDNAAAPPDLAQNAFQGKWPDQLLTHRFGLSTLRQRSAPPACIARTPEKRKNFHWFGGSYGESRVMTGGKLGSRSAQPELSFPKTQIA